MDKNKIKSESGERLRQARVNAGFKSARSAAMHFGWTTSTYAAHENGQVPRVPIDDAKRYATAFGVDAFWILHGTIPTTKSNHRIEETSHSATAGEVTVFRDLKILGTVSAGNWRQPFAFNEDAQETVKMLVETKWNDGAVYALRVEGNSFNKHAPHGSHVSVINIEDAKRDVVTGDAVVIERYDEDKYVETTLKTAKLINGSWVYFPESTDPSFKPIYPEKNETIVVKAFVLDVQKRLARF